MRFGPLPLPAARTLWPTRLRAQSRLRKDAVHRSRACALEDLGRAIDGSLSIHHRRSQREKSGRLPEEVVKEIQRPGVPWSGRRRQRKHRPLITSYSLTSQHDVEQSHTPKDERLLETVCGPEVLQHCISPVATCSNRRSQLEHSGRGSSTASRRAIGCTVECTVTGDGQSVRVTSLAHLGEFVNRRLCPGTAWRGRRNQLKDSPF